VKNIALIGYGSIGKKIFNKSLKEKSLSINKILKKKITKLKLSNVKFFTNFKTFVKSKKNNGYIIATPLESHYEYARKIIQQNKSFIIEKPLVANLVELEELYKKCKNYKQSIFINHSDLYNPTFLIFLKNIKLIGTYKKIEMFFGKYQEIKGFDILNKNNSFLPSFDWMPHPLAITIKLAGLPKKIKILKNNLYLKKKILFQKSNINLYCKNKVVNIKFSNSYLIPKKRVIIKGSKATLIYDGYKRAIFIKKKNNKYFKRVFYSKIDSLENLLKLFYLSLKKKYHRNDIHLAYKIMKVLFKIENKMKRTLILNTKN
jgi:predicted dehydrogenase